MATATTIVLWDPKPAQAVLDEIQAHGKQLESEGKLLRFIENPPWPDIPTAPAFTATREWIDRATAEDWITYILSKGTPANWQIVDN